MRRTNFDPKKPLRYVRYARMSTKQQNARSPEQQFAEIDATLQRMNLAWQHMTDYRDDGVSGRYLMKRPGFNKMLVDIRQRRIAVDAILLHTWERIGRLEDLAAIRRELEDHYGVLILTADSGFCDPTSVSGKALGFVDNIRATEENRIKAVAVLRGKRDAARQKHWPGSKPPLGFRLESVLTERHGRTEVDYSVLVPDAATAWIIRKLFAQARESGWGSTKLARWFNSEADIPEGRKPVQHSTISRWLDNPLYKGVLVFEQVETDVVGDSRIIRRHAPDEMLIIEEYCQPLVEPAVWEEVHELRRQRGEISRKARAQRAGKDDKVIQPRAPGLPLKYPLSGLVLCGTCGRAMTISSCGAYRTKSGKMQKYQSYFCSVHGAAACANGRRFSESWLRHEVLERLSAFLHAGPDPQPRPLTVESLQATGWFQELLKLVDAELERCSSQQEDRRPFLETELAEAQRSVSGYRQSLANPELDPRVRGMIEKDWQQAIARIEELKRDLLVEMRNRQRTAEDLVDPQIVVDRLNRLGDVLASGNVPELNVELSHYIDGIRCFHDGRVVLRFCRVGVSPELIDEFSRAGLPQEKEDVVEGAPLEGSAIPRRRRIRQFVDRSVALFAANPNRFAGLPEDCFAVQRFYVPQLKTWPEEHATEVFEMRFAADGRVKMTFEELEKHFRVSKPTLRAAIQIAQQARSQDRERRTDDAA